MPCLTLCNMVYIEPSKMTVAQLMDYWLEECNRHSVKPSTYMTNYGVIKNHIKPKLGQVRLRDLRKDMVQRFINELLAEGLNPATIKLIYGKLAGALKEAVNSEFIAKSPAFGIVLPKKEKKEMRVLTPEEQVRFVEAAKLYDQGEAFILMLGTGMRVGEVMALTWDCVSFENAEIRVRKTLVEFIDPNGESTKRQISHGTPKTKNSNRSIPLLPQLVEMLKSIQEEQIAFAQEAGSAYTDNNLVFCNRFGASLLRGNVYDKLNCITRRAELEGIHPHSLRHTFATRGLENGIPLKVMQELLGHASIEITADLYTHVLPETKQGEIMKLADTINWDD